MNKGYDSIAAVYNKYWPSQSHLFFRLVFEKLLPDVEPGAPVLDLCCGTGQMCAYYLEEGYKVTGLDMSEKMLEVARQNATGAAFLQADASSFKCDESFDVVTSFFDSMNHILDAQALLNCFKSVKTCLKEGGRFLFDLNDYEAFMNIADGGFFKIEDEQVCIMSPSFDADSGLATYQIVVFHEENGNWLREDTEVFERYYSGDLIVKLLKDAGFSEIYAFDGEEEFDLPHFAGRQFFMAR